MREIKLFVCTTCRTAYCSVELAEQCEARGGGKAESKSWRYGLAGLGAG